MKKENKVICDYILSLKMKKLERLKGSKKKKLLREKYLTIFIFTHFQ